MDLNSAIERGDAMLGGVLLGVSPLLAVIPGGPSRSGIVMTREEAAGFRKDENWWREQP